jgi:hypothetical protein
MGSYCVATELPKLQVVKDSLKAEWNVLACILG